MSSLIIDPDYHLHEILKTAHATTGLFSVGMGGLGSIDLNRAFGRAVGAGLFHMVDLTTADAKGTLVKIFRLTPEGWKRRRELEIKFPLAGKRVEGNA